MKQAVSIEKKRNPLKFAGKVISKREKRIYNVMYRFSQAEKRNSC